MLDSLQTIALGLLSATIGGVIVALANYRFNKTLETNSLQRAQAARIAAFFAKWTKYSGKDKKILNEVQLYDYYEELDRMSYELFLWIKDEELVKDIMERLTLKEDAPKVEELLVRVRELILNKKPKKLKADDVVRWNIK